MPFRLVALYDVFDELRYLVVPSRVEADHFDLLFPGLLSGYIALIADQCWLYGELPLWAPAKGGELEQVAWRPGHFIDWPDIISDVAIAEYRVNGLRGLLGLLGPEEKLVLHRRERIVASAAGADRLRAVMRTKLSKMPKSASPAEIEKWLRAQGPLSEKEAMKRAKNRFTSRKPPRSRLRLIHATLKRENEALKPPRGRPRKK